MNIRNWVTLVSIAVCAFGCSAKNSAEHSIENPYGLHPGEWKFVKDGTNDLGVAPQESGENDCGPNVATWVFRQSKAATGDYEAFRDVCLRQLPNYLQSPEFAAGLKAQAAALDPASPAALLLNALADAIGKLPPEKISMLSFGTLPPDLTTQMNAFGKTSTPPLAFQLRTEAKTTDIISAVAAGRPVIVLGDMQLFHPAAAPPPELAAVADLLKGFPVLHYLVVVGTSRDAVTGGPLFAVRNTDNSILALDEHRFLLAWTTRQPNELPAVKALLDVLQIKSNTMIDAVSTPSP